MREQDPQAGEKIHDQCNQEQQPFSVQPQHGRLVLHGDFVHNVEIQDGKARRKIVVSALQCLSLPLLEIPFPVCQLTLLLPKRLFSLAVVAGLCRQRRLRRAEGVSVIRHMVEAGGVKVVQRHILVGCFLDGACRVQGGCDGGILERVGRVLKGACFNLVGHGSRQERGKRKEKESFVWSC